MQMKKFGNSDMFITPIGFGAWAAGGSWEWGWGSQDDNDSVAAIHRSLELGVNWIDTAAIYGLGHSEEVVAKALKGMTDKPYIFTKCSQVWDEKGEIRSSLKADSLRGELESSLRRLQVEVIDLYQVHWPFPEDELVEGWETLAAFQKEGKVRWIGTSNYSVAQLAAMQAIAPVTSNQPPYSPIKTGVQDEILPFCLKQDIGIIVYSPMQAGLLSGKMSHERVANLPKDDWRLKDDEFQEPRLTRNLKLQDLLVEIGKKHDVSAGVVSIAWTLHNPAVTAAIVGARHPNQVDGTIKALDFRLSHEEYDQIQAFIAVNP